jgi:hypothetical protein
MEQQLKRFANIVKIVNSEYFNDLGKVELIINDNIDIIKFKIIPHEGIHKDIEYYYIILISHIDIIKFKIIHFIHISNNDINIIKNL